jgi:hypothetical protein
VDFAVEDSMARRDGGVAERLGEVTLPRPQRTTTTLLTNRRSRMFTTALTLSTDVMSK